MRNMFRIGSGFMRMKGIGNGGGGLIIHGGNNLVKNATFSGINMRNNWTDWNSNAFL